MNHHHKRHALPLTTGRVGLQQETGTLTFYGHNVRGTGAGVFMGQWKGWEHKHREPTCWPRPSFQCRPWASGCSCGGCGGGCFDSTRLFAAMLTDPRWLMGESA